MAGRSTREILEVLDENLRTYSNTFCVECGDFLSWDEITQHVHEKHNTDIPENVILGEN